MNLVCEFMKYTVPVSGDIFVQKTPWSLLYSYYCTKTVCNIYLSNIEYCIKIKKKQPTGSG